MKYFGLSLPEMWICQEARHWLLEQQKANVLCSACQRVLPGWFPTPIDIVYNTRSYPIRSYHRHSPSRTGIALIDKVLLERLRPFLPSVAIGRALDLTGKEVGTHATLYPGEAIDTRGDPPRKIDVCIECGTIRAYPATSEPSCFIEFQVEGRDCVIDRTGSIYIAEHLVPKIKIDDLKPLLLQPVEVKSRPIDGLRYPGDPDWVQGRDASVSWDPTVTS